MADIRDFWVVRHLRAEASSHVLVYRRGALAASGRGVSLWFLPMSTSLVEIPVDDRELALAVHARSSDFQDVSVQGVVTYRVIDPVRAAERVDFSIDGKRGVHLARPLEKISLSLSQLAQEHAAAWVGRTPLREVLRDGATAIRERVHAALSGDASVTDLGLEVVSVRVASLVPTTDLERALEAPMRERIQQEADEAAFARRALAVEKERAIQENELTNQIELARREEQLIAQKGGNARRQASEDAEARRIASEAEAARLAIAAEADAQKTRVVSEAEAARTRVSADAEAQKTRVTSEAQADALRSVETVRVEQEHARMEIHRATPPIVLAALAARELASKLSRIDHLHLGTEIAPLLTELISAGTRTLEAREQGSSGTAR